jgi:hypothetical protein
MCNSVVDLQSMIPHALAASMGMNPLADYMAAAANAMSGVNGYGHMMGMVPGMTAVSSHGQQSPLLLLNPVAATAAAMLSPTLSPSPPPLSSSPMVAMPSSSPITVGPTQSASIVSGPANVASTATGISSGKRKSGGTSGSGSNKGTKVKSEGSHKRSKTSSSSTPTTTIMNDDGTTTITSARPGRPKSSIDKSPKKRERKVVPPPSMINTNTTIADDKGNEGVSSQQIGGGAAKNNRVIITPAGSSIAAIIADNATIKAALPRRWKREWRTVRGVDGADIQVLVWNTDTKPQLQNFGFRLPLAKRGGGTLSAATTITGNTTIQTITDSSALNPDLTITTDSYQSNSSHPVSSSPSPFPSSTGTNSSRRAEKSDGEFTCPDCSRSYP